MKTVILALLIMGAWFAAALVIGTMIGTAIYHMSDEGHARRRLP